jgi:hypothetical protein
VGKVGWRREGGEQRMEERMENVGEDPRRGGRGASVLGGEEGEAPEWLDERKEERRREWRENEEKRVEERRRGEKCV